MCRRCAWGKAIPLMKKLAALEKAKRFKGWLDFEAGKVEREHHITDLALSMAQKIEQTVGIKTRGDYDVQQDQPRAGGSRSGLFR